MIFLYIATSSQLKRYDQALLDYGYSIEQLVDKASEVPVPAGYKMVTTGSCSVRTKKIEIYVKK